MAKNKAQNVGFGSLGWNRANNGIELELQFAVEERFKFVGGVKRRKSLSGRSVVLNDSHILDEIVVNFADFDCESIAFPLNVPLSLTLVARGRTPRERKPCLLLFNRASNQNQVQSA